VQCRRPIRSVCRLYADGLEYTEGGRRRISNAVTAGTFLATCLQLRRRPRVRRRQPSAYGLLRRRPPYADGLLRTLFWRRPTPTAPTFGRRRRCRPSASSFIPVVKSAVQEHKCNPGIFTATSICCFFVATCVYEPDYCG
jgi:hypothetical protein